MKNPKNLTSFFFSLFLFLLFFSNPGLADLYKWVDENGNTHFSDTPPPEENNAQIEAMASVGGTQHKSGSSDFLREKMYLYYPDTKRLTEPQKRKIEQKINGFIARGRLSFEVRIWFVRINANDYTDNLWLLDADVFCLPHETTNRLNVGYALTLKNYSPDSLDSPDQWPSYFAYRKYYHVKPASYINRGKVPYPADIPQFSNLYPPKRILDSGGVELNSNRFLGKVDKNMLVECVDMVKSKVRLRDNPLEVIFFQKDSFDENGALNLFSALTLKKAIHFKKTKGQWTIESRNARLFRAPDGNTTSDRMTSVPSSQKTTTLTEEQALEICLPVLKKRIANDAGRTLKKVQQTEFNKYPGTKKARIEIDYLASDGLSLMEDKASCTFVGKKITDIHVYY